jgi:hypothetical protein
LALTNSGRRPARAANYDAFRATFGYRDKGQYTPPADLDDKDANGFTLEHTTTYPDDEDRVTKPAAVYGTARLPERGVPGV